MKKLLYIDASFTLAQIRKRKLNQVFDIRFLEGYFQKVWSTHPTDTQPGSADGVNFAGAPLFEDIDDHHVFIRGRYGRFRWLQYFRRINVALGLINYTRTLIKLCKTEQIKYIRGSDPLVCGLIGLIVSKRVGGRLAIRINSNHDEARAEIGGPIMPSLFPLVFIEKFVERLVIRCADVIFAPSENYKDFALKRGIKDDKIALVGYGNLIDPVHLIDPKNRPASHEIPDVSGHAELLVCVGRLQKIKRSEDCYEVLKVLLERGHNVVLIFVGDGPLREQLERRAILDKIEKNVIFTGSLSQSALASLLPLCSLALSPITGRALAEVAFAGLPVVAYDLDWQGTLVQNKNTGFLVSPGNIHKMAECAEKIISNKIQRELMGGRIRKLAHDVLNPALQTRLEISAYERCFDR